jgi:predicted DNA-binding transcriptional regulator YafY
MPVPELTLRQQAVWYLWGLHRMRIEELAQLFRVTPRTICRDLAALRARGWRRPRVKDTPAQLSLDLIVEVRTRLDAAFRTAYTESPIPRPRSEREAMLAGLQQATRMEAELVLTASQLARAMQREQAALRPEEVEAMRQELAVALATMLRRP